jgi:hypothetical protein
MLVGVGVVLLVVPAAIAGWVAVRGGQQPDSTVDVSTDGQVAGGTPTPAPASPDAGKDPQDQDRDSPTPTPGDATRPPLNAGRLADATAASIVRVDSLRCGAGQAGGTGVILDEAVLTGSRIVEQAMAIAVVFSDGTVAEARPRSLSAASGLAVLDVATNAAGDLAAGEQAGAGRRGALLNLSEDGDVTGRAVNIQRDSSGLTVPVATDAMDLGSPVIGPDGRLLAVVSATGDPTTVAGGETITQMLGSASSSTQRQQTTCAQPERPQRPLDVTIASGVDHQQATAVADTYRAYFDGINDQQVQRAYAQYSRRWRGNNTLEGFAAGVQTTYYPSDPRLVELRDDGDGLVARVRFVSLQHPGEQHAPQPGERCSVWNLEHRLVEQNGAWRIDGLHDDGGGQSLHTPC